MIFQSFSSSIVESTIGIPKKLLVNLTINRARVLIDIVYFCVTSITQVDYICLFFQGKSNCHIPCVNDKYKNSKTCFGLNSDFSGWIVNPSEFMYIIVAELLLTSIVISHQYCLQWLLVLFLI